MVDRSGALVSFLRTQPSPGQALDEARARPLGDLFCFVKETCQRWWFAKQIVPLYLERQVSLPSWSTLGLAERCHDCQKITSFGEARLGGRDRSSF